MLIRLLTVGKRAPSWVEAGVSEYTKRLPREYGFSISVVAPARGHKKHDVSKARAEEGARLLAAVPTDDLIVALDASGRAFTSEELAGRCKGWLAAGRNVALLIGGVDGLDRTCLERADLIWSLSRLTLPHALVRVVVAEQIYRASSILSGHPYHR